MHSVCASFITAMYERSGICRLNQLDATTQRTGEKNKIKKITRSTAVQHVATNLI